MLAKLMDAPRPVKQDVSHTLILPLTKYTMEKIKSEQFTDHCKHAKICSKSEDFEAIFGRIKKEII